jgi:hypothetical protein
VRPEACEDSPVKLLQTRLHAGLLFGVPPTQLVDRSCSAYKRNRRPFVLNPTNAVGGSFILSLQERPAAIRPESHQRSWWIVHTRPERGCIAASFPESHQRNQHVRVIRHGVYLDQLLPLLPNDAGDVFLKLFFEVWSYYALPHGDGKTP